MSSKAALREAYKARRRELNAEQREELSLDITNKCLELDIWKGRYYHIFLPIERQLEINTHHLLTVLQGKDRSVVLSRSDMTSAGMRHILLEEHTRIKENAWGIPEPVAGLEVEPQLLDVVFVPLLAFDLHGNRVGYGKGFYDRFLGQCRSDAKFVGLSFFQAVDLIDEDPLDIRLHYAVTPDKIYEF